MLLAPVVAGLIAGFGPGRLVWLVLGLAILALDRAGHASAPPRPGPRRRSAARVAPPGRQRWRRQLRRRRIINRRQRLSAQRRQARAVRDARERRRRRRNLRRRRQVQARGGWLGTAAGGSGEIDRAVEAGPAAPTGFDLADARSEGQIDVDLSDAGRSGPAIEIDLRDEVVYGSEITLESGDILESGVVGPGPELRPVSGPQPHD